LNIVANICLYIVVTGVHIAWTVKDITSRWVFNWRTWVWNTSHV